MMKCSKTAVHKIVVKFKEKLILMLNGEPYPTKVNHILQRSVVQSPMSSVSKFSPNCLLEVKMSSENHHKQALNG